ncbi:hypothetical protein M0R72_06170 [Candidatus Pacearchaeota archaeon]|jgi:predicted TIM-barrel fold metal-dependent hydrolase|nr:hypothetical protein [Candidatus Pacearchaeota archaeon]
MALTKIQAAVIRRAIKSLKRSGCNFDMCDGPSAKYQSMKTCSTCSAIKDLQFVLDGKPRTPDHAGWVSTDKQSWGKGWKK